MTWMMPLEASMSAWVTVASLTCTPLVVSKNRVSSATESATAGMDCESTSPGTTW